MESRNSLPRRAAAKEGDAASVPNREPTSLTEAGPSPVSVHPEDIPFSPGTRLRLGATSLQLVHALSLDRLLVKDLETGETRIVARAEVRRADARPGEREPRRETLNSAQSTCGRSPRCKSFVSSRSKTRIIDVTQKLTGDINE